MFLDFKCLITLTQVLLLSPQILTETLWDGGGGGGGVAGRKQFWIKFLVIKSMFLVFQS